MGNVSWVLLNFFLYVFFREMKFNDLTSIIRSYSFIITNTKWIQYRRYVHIAQHAATRRAIGREYKKKGEKTIKFRVNKYSYSISNKSINIYWLIPFIYTISWIGESEYNETLVILTRHIRNGAITIRSRAHSSYSWSIVTIFNSIHTIHFFFLIRSNIIIKNT